MRADEISVFQSQNQNKSVNPRRGSPRRLVFNVDDGDRGDTERYQEPAVHVWQTGKLA